MEISLFDRTMGASEEWARKTMGTVEAGAPFEGSQVTPVPARVRSEVRDGAWLFDVTLAIPPPP